MNLRTSLSTIALTLISATAWAQAAAPAASTAMPRVDARRAEQQQRIQQGVASGALTPHETQHLEREQKHIAHAEKVAKADGVVTPRERAHLDRMQNAASRDIAREKHDAQAAGK
jgi:hypothetical protein